MSRSDEWQFFNQKALLIEQYYQAVDTSDCNYTFNWKDQEKSQISVWTARYPKLWVRYVSENASSLKGLV